MSRIGLLIFGCALAGAAHAGIYLEPYVGYGTGKSTRTGATTLEMKGLTYGARGGYALAGFSFGLEYFAVDFKDDQTSPVKWSAADIGLFAGYATPIGIRFYGTYFVVNEWKASFTGGSSKYKGSEMKVGLGYKPLDFLSVNLEYVMNSFDKIDGNPLSPKREGKFYLLTLSAPFDF